MENSILIIRTDKGSSQNIEESLKKEWRGKIALAKSRDEGIRLAGAEKGGPDLIILDIDRDLSILRAVREGSSAPILILSRDKNLAVEALNSFADGFVVKPYSSNEVLARVRALLRRIR